MNPRLDFRFWFALGHVLAAAMAGINVRSCELCAVYNASAAQGSSRGVFLSLSEQYIAFRREMLGGSSLHRAQPDGFDRSISHVVLGYDFSSRFGLSANLPVMAFRYDRFDIQYFRNRPPVLARESGTIFGLGDLALIGRVGVFERMNRRHSVVLQALAGLKVPTGDPQRIREEVEQTELYDQFLPPGTPHDPLGHSVSSVHLHDLAEGSGSWDGVFGLTLSTRWERAIFNAQFQYSLRTRGESGFRFGDDLLISGGPGIRVISNPTGTLTLQALFSFETTGRSELGGRSSDRTGMSMVYAGPQLTATLGSRWSLNAGVDFPVSADANGFQVVPEHRVHGGVSVRF